MHKNMKTSMSHIVSSERTSRLLACQSTGWCTEEDDRQVATHPQRSCTSCIEPQQARPRSDTVPAPDFTLEDVHSVMPDL